MRIAIFTHNYPSDAGQRKDAGTFVYDFAQKLSEKNKVFVFCPDYGGKKEKNSKVPVYWFKYGGKKLGNFSFLNPFGFFKIFQLLLVGCKEARKFVVENKIEYILCAWAVPSGIFAWYASFKLKVPYGIWGLGSDINLYSKIPVLGFLMGEAIKRANNLYANSFALCKLINKKYFRKCVFLPAATNFTSSILGKRTTNKKTVNILCIGRLEKIKGIDLLLRSCRLLLEKKVDFNLKIVGDGSMFIKLQKYILDNNLSLQVQLLGNKGIKDVSKLMSESDFLTVPSRNESLPLVIIEAAHYNLPVVAANVGDCEYVLNKYKTGFVFAKENIEDMSKKIIKMISNENYKRYAKHGKFEELVKDYSLESSVKIFLNTIS